MRAELISATTISILCLPLLCSAARGEGQSEQLFAAIHKNDVAAVKTLLRKGADVNVKDSDGATPLIRAALHASPECVKALLEKGADPNAANPAGATALMWGIHDLRKVRLLLDKGANVNARSKAGKTALLLAASYAGAAETVKLLLDKGADVAAKDEAGATAVLLAAENGDVAVLKLLIEKGGDVNARAGHGFNEAQFGTVTAVRQDMVREREKLNFGITPLMAAAGQGNIEAVKVLLEKGAEVNAKAGGGLMALHLAARHRDAGLVRALLERGAEVNAKDPEGNTPLIIAAASDALTAEVVQALLDKQADANAKGLDGLTALVWARKKGETPIAKMLIKAGASE